MEQPVSRRRRQAEETSSLIVSRARNLFSERGFDAVSIDDIVQAEGLTKGAFYHHFETKEALFLRVFTTVLRETVAGFGDSWPPSSYPESLVRDIVDRYGTVASSEPYRTIVLFEGPRVLGWRRWRQIEAEYTLPLIRAILRSASGPVFDRRPDRSEVTARHIMALLFEHAALIVDGSPETVLAASRDTLAVLVVSGLNALNMEL